MPFTVEQFMEVFRNYNTAIKPLLAVMVILGLIIIGRPFRNTKYFTQVKLWTLAGMWLVNGIGYHIMFFSKVNPIAKVFGAFFILQAIMLIIQGVMAAKRAESTYSTARLFLGWAMIFYGILLYSIVGMLLGHYYPAVPKFGVAPCPTVIFTLGVLLIFPKRICLPVFIIPLLWVCIGTVEAFKMGMKEDLGLLISGLITIYFLFDKKSIKSVE